MMGWEKNSEVREVDELLWEHSEKYFLGIFYNSQQSQNNVKILFRG